MIREINDVYYKKTGKPVSAKCRVTDLLKQLVRRVTIEL
jgi:hypothetical protein